MVLGGGRPDLPGAFVEPTLLTDVTPDMRAYREELFGPVATVYRVADEDEDEAVALANTSPPTAWEARSSPPTRNCSRSRGPAGGGHGVDQLSAGDASRRPTHEPGSCSLGLRATRSWAHTRSRAGLPEMCGSFLSYSWGDWTCAFLTRQTQARSHPGRHPGECSRLSVRTGRNPAWATWCGSRRMVSPAPSDRSPATSPKGSSSSRST
ncbi:aldehyde dehydrogenase family protein [Streptomyces sp. NPDC005262]|uniref:aldehyde dehydrogenase family protein n=1 Tax=Streptomyces sp. NPDC005262 TaxID=3364710 RepID=UPI0036B32E1E